MRFSSILKNLTGKTPQRKSARRNGKWQTGIAEMLETRQLLTATVTQVGDLNVVADSDFSNPQELTVIGNTVFYTANDKTHGRELSKKEGTNAAVLVKDVYPGISDSRLMELKRVPRWPKTLL